MSPSKKPDEQRKKIAEADMHEKQKMISSPLEKDLREEFGRRNLPLRSGDEVEVTRGDFKEETSEVRDVDLEDLEVTLEDVTREKVDGTETRPKIDPSNLMIIDPDLSDPEREEIIERSGGEVKEEFKVSEEEEGETKEEGSKEEEKEGESEGERAEGFKCKVCGDVFDSKRGLNIHKGKSHPDHVK